MSFPETSRGRVSRRRPAGALVGIADGVRAAVLGHVRLRGLLACVALTLGFDVLVAAAGGAALALLILVACAGDAGEGPVGSPLGRLASGGRRLRGRGHRGGHGHGRPQQPLSRCRRGGAGNAGGSVAASFRGAGIAASARRVARFSAASPTRGSRAAVSPAGVLVLAPLLGVILEAVVFMLVWRTRAPLRKDVLAARATWVACLSGLLPFLLAWASARLSRVRWWQASIAAGILFGAPVAYLFDCAGRRIFSSCPGPWWRWLLASWLRLPALSLLLRERAFAGGGIFALVVGRPVLALVAVFTPRNTSPRARRLRRAPGWPASCSRLASA
jgi:hypothetical protein